MKSLRGKLFALLGAGMVLQMGGCSITDVVGEVLNSAIPDLVGRLLGV